MLVTLRARLYKECLCAKFWFWLESTVACVLYFLRSFTILRTVPTSLSSLFISHRQLKMRRTTHERACPEAQVDYCPNREPPTAMSRQGVRLRSRRSCFWIRDRVYCELYRLQVWRAFDDKVELIAKLCPSGSGTEENGVDSNEWHKGDVFPTATCVNAIVTRVGVIDTDSDRGSRCSGSRIENDGRCIGIWEPSEWELGCMNENCNNLLKEMNA